MTTNITEVIHACQSENSAKSMEEIVNITEDDFSRDILYHSSCKLTLEKVRKCVQYPQRGGSSSEDIVDNASVIATEMEFFDELLDQIDSGEYITTV